MNNYNRTTEKAFTEDIPLIHVIIQENKSFLQTESYALWQLDTERQIDSRSTSVLVINKINKIN